MYTRIYSLQGKNASIHKKTELYDTDVFVFMNSNIPHDRLIILAMN